MSGLTGVITATLLYLVITTVSIIHLAKIIRHMDKRLRAMEQDFARLLGRGHSGTRYGTDKDYY
jgi:hypothetical protein